MTFEIKEARAIALTFGAATAGGAVFASFGMPAAWLTGSMLVIVVLALAKAPLALPDLIRDLVFLALGIQIGSGFAPETIDRIATWPISLIGLGITMLVVIAASTVFLIAQAKWSRPTALYASIPGALSYVLALSLRSAADTRLVMLAQMLRLVALLAILPSVASLSIASAGGSQPQASSIGDLLILLAAGGVLAYVLEKRNFPAGALFGGMFASAILHVFGIVDGQMPDFILIPGQLILGALIGIRFMETDLDFIKRAFLPSFGAFVIAAFISCLGALVVAWMLQLPAGQLIVAFAPGGIEAMTILAVVLGLDPAFVATHQLARFFGLALTLPMIAKIFLKDP